MTRESLKYYELTEKIIGCAMTVHSIMGCGFQESIYQKALALEFQLNAIGFEKEKSMPIFYKDRRIGSRRADFFVEKKIMLELKAVSVLEKVHKAQAINYLEVYNKEVGLLINFGQTSLEFKRLYNKKFL